MANRKKTTGLTLANALKKSLLQSAIMGKLVPQNSDDGNAQDLLTQIQTEKQTLIQNGKLKKEKPLAPITDDEKPFEIPENWVWVRLGDLTSILGDGLHGTPEYSLNGEFAFINGNNLNDEKITIKENTKFVSESEYQKYKKPLNHRTVFVSINGTLGNVAFYNNEKIVLGKSACYFNLLDNIDKFYIKYILYSPYYLDYASKKATGTTIKNLSLKAMRDLLIPLPPLAEQARIVAKLDEILPKIDTLAITETTLNALNAKFPKQMQSALLQSAIMGKLVPQNSDDGNAQDLLTQIQTEKQTLIANGKLKKEKPFAPITDDEKPFEIPDNWVWVRLGEIGIIQTGTTPSKSDNENYGSDFPFFKPADLSQNENIVNASEFLSNKGKQKARIALKYSILINGIGNIGNLGILKTDGAFNQQMHALTTHNGIDYKLAYYFLSSPFVQSEMKDNSSQTTLPIFNKSKFENIIIPLPPLAEQARIVAKLDEVLPKVRLLDEWVS